ncbi:peptidoglycan bridge formation protein FemAB [Fervidicella metallireducens AeB]|uniref:Peptidoglycan bridge formation protein FemAB n=1 Tax=Fervidicella metallireducens AeB TaxID=1403537 RepID=A0A017S0R3_9CLOT|nr:peptidoglycan bridge formation glycyltransferase FemA/FemB family protein [Fervidicella metallireducens]EYE89770.1 peptidoglycan bridge formation protein FemAB [Fervidicella metallireducens AeB]
MYNFKEIDSSIINDFNNKNSKGHIFQTSYWADVKREWKSRFIGGYTSNGELVLTCTILLRKIPYLNKYMGYIPRGFTCDYNNENLVGEFTDFLKNYSKKNNIAFISIDPDIHLKENEITIENGEKIKEMLVSLGYNHKNTKNFENIQPNFVFRLNFDMSKNIDDRKKEIFNNFSSKTRYNIKVAQDRGLTVEIYDKNNITEEILDKFHELMVITGERDNFITRPRAYFKNMLEKLSPYCKIYMLKYNYQIDYNRLKDKLDTQIKNKERLLKKKDEILANLKSETETDKILKLEKKLADTEKNITEAERQIKSFLERIDSISEFKDKQNVYVSGAIYLYYGGKAWYLYGASHNILRDTMPNFLMQWKMIEDSIDLNCYMYDFRGVSGDLNPENPLYGLYKFKKGFNGDFVEFLGEFDLIINSFVYSLFRFVLPKFKKIRTSLIKRK